MTELRPYQAKAVTDIEAEINGPSPQSVLLVSPTGAGKTVIASTIVANAVAAGKRVLILVHRREIL
jgi:DNA repair protein RadD